MATKVYLDYQYAFSWAIHRVVTALMKYAPPEVERVSSMGEADIVILHAVGRRNAIASVARKVISNNKQKLSIIQYALRGTKEPSTTAWMPIWKHAHLVWSYLDLYELSIIDNNGDYPMDFNFYYSPLGADSDIFYPLPGAYHYKFSMITIGDDDKSECLRESVAASKIAQTRIIHVGYRTEEVYAEHIASVDDNSLRRLYNSSAYVSGLRRIEGFELPAAEGLLCGARPIMFDLPVYRKWFDGLAVFIPETKNDMVVNNLANILNGSYQPVSSAEIALAKERFDWSKIVSGFWERLL